MELLTLAAVAAAELLALVQLLIEKLAEQVAPAS
jgi:hypothetical protein